MKSENLAICYAIVTEQIMKTSGSEAEANTKLYAIGQEMGLRMTDEFNMRDCSYLSQVDTVKSLLSKIVQISLGLTIELSSEDIQFQKRNHFYKLNYKETGVSKSILGLCEDVNDKFKTLQPAYVVAGFIYGVLRTMDFYGEVKVMESDGQREGKIYAVDVKKDIKNED